MKIRQLTIRVHVLLRSVAVLHMDYNLYDGYVYVFCALVLCVQCLVWLRFILIAVAGVQVVWGCPLPCVACVRWILCIKYVALKFLRKTIYYRNLRIRCSRRAPLSCDLRKALSIIGFTLKGPPKWSFEVILEVWEDIWWECTSVLRIARFQTSLVQISRAV